MQRQTIKKFLLIIAGSLALALGMIGLLLPILPTTPFLILAAYCYMRSSERLYRWLIAHKLFGPYIYNYVTYRAVFKKTKVAAMILLWVSLLISIVVVNNLPIRLLLLAIGLAVSIHIATLKTLTRTRDTERLETSNATEEFDLEPKKTGGNDHGRKQDTGKPDGGIRRRITGE